MAKKKRKRKSKRKRKKQKSAKKKSVEFNGTDDFIDITSDTIPFPADFTISAHIPTPKKKRKSWIPDGVAFGILKFAVQKLIIKVPDDKKERVINSTGKFLTLLARELAEGAARGATQEIRNNN